MEKPADHDSYLATLPNDQRAALADLRQRLAALLPSAQEGMSYGLPAFRIGNKAIAGYAAFKNHLSYFPQSGSILATLEADITAAGLKASKGALRFTPAKPLPDALLERLVAARLQEAGLS